MALPSVKTLVHDSKAAFVRFPLAILSAIAGTLFAICISELSYGDSRQETFACLIMVSSLGLTLFFSLAMFSERKQHTRNQKFILQGGGLLLLIAYYIYLRAFFVQTEFVRYALINISFHLFASFSAFTQKDHLTGFWQFNKSLFLRFFFSGIYSATLFIGLALAMAATDKLFNVHFRDQRYFQLWVILAGVFNTWFFLAGIPRNLDELDNKDDYPKGLKIFTQYVLLPLVTLYLIILYAYMGKILVSQSLPKGWVSYLVIGFSVVGILALLLVHPIRNKEGNSWIHIFSKWFYSAMYPLIIMLFIAIFRRISDYGITENRYFIIVVALWLAAIATYFIFSKAQNIKLIPITLCLIALLSSVGPWSAFSVAERSQFNRLETMLEQNKILVNGKVDIKHSEVNDSVAGRIRSVLVYFDGMHSFQPFKPWFNENVDSLFADSLRWGRVTNMLKALHVQEVYNYNYSREDDEEDGYYPRYFSFYPAYNDQSQVRSVAGYDYEFPVNATPYSYSSNYANNFPLQKDTFAFSITTDSLHMEFVRNGRPVYSLDMNQFIKTMNDSCRKNNYDVSNVPQRFLQTSYEDSSLALKLEFTGIYGYLKNKIYKTNSISGTCLMKLKNTKPQ